MPIVPSGNLTKSLKTGTPYSPAVSFNPDKKALFDTHSTTLGVLATSGLTTDGVNVSVPIGTSFIQNGIVVTLTSVFLAPIGGGAFPKYVVASNVDETAGSAVTIEVLSTIAAPQVELARLTPNDSTIVQAPQISIRALRAAVDAAALDVEQDDASVKTTVGTLNAIGPNALLSNGPGDQANLTVKLDAKEAGVAKTVRTEELNFLGATVTAVTATKADVDARLQVKDEGTLINSATRKVNFRGVGSVAATQDGGDTLQVNVDVYSGGGIIGALESVMGDGIVKGLLDGDAGTRQVNATALYILIGGAIYGPITGAVAVTTNVSGSPRTDLVQYDGIAITVKAGTPGATFPCPAPDTGNIPIAVVLVPDTPSNLVKSVNKQVALANPVIVAHYYANGGLHASRVGVTSDPSSTSTTYVDAEEMALSVYFPRVGYRYELNWDTVIKQDLYGFLNEGAFINMSWDGSDEDDAVVARGVMGSNLLGGVSIHGWEKSVSLHYQRLVTVGSHQMVGRWRVGQASTPEELSEKRRRIWIVETA